MYCICRLPRDLQCLAAYLLPKAVDSFCEKETFVQLQAELCAIHQTHNGRNLFSVL